MKTISLLIVFMVISKWAFLAEFAGVVKDKNSKEPIPYASISIVDLNVLIECDSAGVFRLNINVPSRFSLIVSAVGYESVQLVLEENNPASLEIFLEQSLPRQQFESE